MDSQQNAESQSTIGKASTAMFTSLISAVIVAFSLFPLSLFIFSLCGRYNFAAELISNFRLYIFFMLLPFPLFLWLVKQWKWGIVLAVAVTWSMFGVVFVYLPGYQPPEGKTRLKIMSLNLFEQSHSIQRVAKTIRENDPDVLVLIEYANHWPDQLESIEKRFPYRIQEPRWHGFGIAIFSKLPLRDAEIHQLTNEVTDVPAVLAKIQIDHQLIRFAAVHTLSPTNILRWRLRNKQLVEVADLLEKESLPTIVIGDFNGTPWSPFFRDFQKRTGCRDSRKGFGYHSSWHRAFWYIHVPIDHAFVSPEIHVHDRFMGDDVGSDHLPLLMEVSVTPQD